MKHIKLLAIGVAALWATGVFAQSDVRQVGQFEVVNETVIELNAGVAGTSAYLSPDGESFAHVTPDDFCIYEVSGEERFCIDRPNGLDPIDTGNVDWSPDGRYVAFNTDFFRTLKDSDIWVLDVAAEALTNITDDGTVELPLLGNDGEAVNSDVGPQWMPDSDRVLFVRYVVDGDIDFVQIASAAPDGSDIRVESTMSREGERRITRALLSPDGTKIAYDVYRNSESTPGLWQATITGRDVQRIDAVPTDDSRPNQLLPIAYSDDGRYLLAYDVTVATGYSLIDQNIIRLFDIELGEEVTFWDDPAARLDYVGSAGWVPGTNAVVFSVFDAQADPPSTLYVRDLTTGDLQTLATDTQIGVPIGIQRLPYTWTQDNVLMYSRLGEGGIVILTFEEQ